MGPFPPSQEEVAAAFLKDAMLRPVPEGPIGPGVLCTTCGYALEGLDAAAVCPECGSPCEKSLRGSLLLYSGDAHFRSLRLGVLVILASIIAMIMGFMGVVVASFALPRATWIGTAAMIGTALLNVAMLYGWWRFAEPDPSLSGQTAGDGHRSLARISAVATTGATIAATLFDVIGGMVMGAPGLVAIALAIVYYLVLAFHHYAAMRYVRWLAPRLPDRAIYDQSRTNMWVLPLLNTIGLAVLAIGPIIALIMYWNHLNRVRKRLAWLAGFRQSAAAIAGEPRHQAAP